MYIIVTLLRFLHQIYQAILITVFSPKARKASKTVGPRRIAVIGAGLTGISAAARCLGHGFDVTIFERGSRKNLGGIWSRLNCTPGFQMQSSLYRFYPSRQWGKGYASQKKISKRIGEVWERYGLQKKARFEMPVRTVRPTRDGKWIVNGNVAQKFDGVIVCVGTCGDPRIPFIPGQDQFQG